MAVITVQVNNTENRWMQYTGQNSSDHIVGQYEILKRLQPHWEKGYFYLGKYYDALLTYV